VTGDGPLYGAVDSSLVDRFRTNSLYVFAGTVTPDDRDGVAPDPVSVVAVKEADDGCSWSYDSASLDPGQYTIALTSDTDSDDPGADDNLTFRRTAQVEIKDSSTKVRRDFDAASVIRVGPTRTYTTLRDAAAAASDGDVIEVDAAVYENDVVVWRADDITVRGVGGGRAHMKSTETITYQSGNDQKNGKGIWLVRGTGFTAENIEFSGAKVTDANGAGIRNEGADLAVCNGYFHDNENGILGGAYGKGMLIEHTEFDHNGLGEYGRTHNIYVGADSNGPLIFRYNYTHRAHIGHNLKTRAPENYILYNRIMDESDGDASYQVDVPNGGLTYLIGNTIQQGPNADNSTIVSYGAEGLRSGRTNDLFAVNNTIVNDRSGGTFFYITGGTSEARLVNNILAGNASVLSGTASTSSNLVTDGDPGFVDRAAFDYHLNASATGAIDAGADPGTGAGYDLAPAHEYVQPLARRTRPSDSTLDRGAYEYEP